MCGYVCASVLVHTCVSSSLPGWDKFFRRKEKVT